MRPNKCCRVIRKCILVLIISGSVSLFVFLNSAPEERRPSIPLQHYKNEVTNQTERAHHSKERPELTSWMAKMEARMAERRNHLKDMCSFYGLDVLGNDSLHRPNPWEFLVNRKYHLVWCNVFKAASTSWMYNFNVLAGYSPRFLGTTKVVALNLARHRYPRPSIEKLKTAVNDSVSFLIVRHPLERLLSAYRDKLQYSVPHSVHQKLGNKIVTMYRTKTPKPKTKAVKTRTPRWPTFSEFVMFLLDSHRKGEPFDMHWTPITEFCTPCQVEFDIIAKFESLEEDQNYVIHLSGLQDIIKPEWKNHAKGSSTNKVVSNYYSQLTRAQIMQLYNIYRYDFELFGYSLDGYLSLGQTETTSVDVPTTR